jgi:glycosyltransferase involved in cell wall biosynthesis
LDAVRQVAPARITVVGAGTRFLSGISYYTLRLSNALAVRHRVSVIAMRQMLPGRFYPGRARLGAKITRLAYDPDVSVFDGVDWYWLPTIMRAIVALYRARPEYVIFQWWTGTVLHSYLLLAAAARLLGARIIVEFHEVLDTAEVRMPLVRAYVSRLAPALMRLADAYVIHTATDRPALQARYGIGAKPVQIIQLGPFDHHMRQSPAAPVVREPSTPFNLLYFGVIRPFKGVEDLVRAFDALPDKVVEMYWLTVVGETWEGWSLPEEEIRRSRHRDRITFVNRYVDDTELDSLLCAADAVVLPYHRSSASGPVHTTMSYGLPLITTTAGGLPEAVAEYAGVILVPPRNVSELTSAIREVLPRRGRRYADPHSWNNTVRAYEALFSAL